MFVTPPGEVIEKLMSCTRAEFETGIRRLTGSPPVKLADGDYDLSSAAGGKPAACAFVPQADAVLSGLFRLPRVKVTLKLAALSQDERNDFAARFDRVFQRGGG